jgi:uncharacterized repeat protein (TIGR03803 family)
MANLNRFSKVVSCLGILLTACGIAPSQTVTILHSFFVADGTAPLDGLVLAEDGNFYGTTFEGGIGSGVIFRISPTGVFTNLHTFLDTPDGSSPATALTRGRDGFLYGTCQGGGLDGNGTVFRISLSGEYTNLYSFGPPPDGNGPAGRLALGSDALIYGTTTGGGFYNRGTIFRISPGGCYSTLYSFGSITNDGDFPLSLMLANDGRFYGTTLDGGTSNLGTIFRISPGGSYTLLHSFGTVTNDGNTAAWPLTIGPDGWLYGCAEMGGIDQLGTLFRVSTNGDYTNLFVFTSNAGLLTNGASPSGGLLLGSDGNFYGSCSGGNPSPFATGVIFRYSPTGAYSRIYAFKGAPDGGGPCQLVQGLDGSFYGTTQNGGTNGGSAGSGTVFKLAVPLDPPCNQITALGFDGSNVSVSVSSISSATYDLQQRGSLDAAGWTNVPGASVTNSIGASITVTNLAGASALHRFFRFLVRP